MIISLSYPMSTRGMGDDLVAGSEWAFWSRYTWVVGRRGLHHLRVDYIKT